MAFFGYNLDFCIFYRIFNGNNIMKNPQKFLYDQNTGAAYGTYKSYIIGFLLSFIITLTSFYIVKYKLFSVSISYIAIVILSILQLYVQVVYFLHVNTHSKIRWNLISFIFTLVIILILFIGTLWIMHNLYKNMMIVTM